jgi:hypothetical protein
MDRDSMAREAKRELDNATNETQAIAGLGKAILALASVLWEKMR